MIAFNESVLFCLCLLFFLSLCRSGVLAQEPPKEDEKEGRQKERRGVAAKDR